MAITKFDTLIPEVSLTLEQCPRPIVLRALQKAAVQFYRESMCYRHAVDESVASSDLHIALTLPAEAEIAAPLEMTLGGNPLTNITPEQAILRFGAWDQSTNGSSSPTHVFRYDGSNLALVPRLSGAAQLRGHVALAPTRNASGVEAAELDKGADAIVYGAIAKLMAMPGTSWYRPDATGYYETQFLRGIRDAGELSRGENVATPGTTSYGGI